MLRDKLRDFKDALLEKLGWGLLILLYSIVCAIISVPYGIVTGARSMPDSLWFMLFMLVAPIAALLTGMMWFSGQVREVMSLRTRLMFTGTWIAPAVVWGISAFLHNYGWVKLAAVLYDFRYATLPLMLLTTFFWAMYRMVSPMVERTKRTANSQTPPSNPPSQDGDNANRAATEQVDSGQSLNSQMVSVPA